MKKKICAICNESKSYKHYAKDAANPDGHNYYCKPCNSKKRKENRRNKKKVFAHPRWITLEGVPALSESSYVVRECEVCLQHFYPKISIQKRCERCSEVAEKIYRKIAGNSGYKKYKRTKVAQLDLVGVTRKYIDASNCVYCGGFFTPENPKSIDHIIPRANSGTNDPDNINICCLECNMSKGSMPLQRWFDLCRRVAQSTLSSSTFTGSGSSLTV